MDAYVFGRHEGDLPLELVGNGPEGNRIRAIAPVMHDDYSIFAAFEAPDEQALESHVSALSASGATADNPFIPCIDTDCMEKVRDALHRVAFLPPWECLLFILIKAEGALEVLRELIEECGADGVAAVTDGSGGFLVEIGASDWTTLDRAHERLLGAANVSTTIAMRVDGGALARA